MTHCPLSLLLVASLSLCTANNVEFKHHNNTELAAVLQQVPPPIKSAKSENF